MDRRLALRPSFVLSSAVCAIALTACPGDVPVDTETASSGGSTGTTDTTTPNPTVPTSSSSSSSGEPPTSDTTAPTTEVDTTTTSPTSDTASPLDTTATGPQTTADTTTTGDTSTGTDTGTGTETETDTTTGDPIEPVVVCDQNPPLMPPAAGTCEVTVAGTQGMLLRGTVLAPDQVFENGAVLVDDAGIIQCVGCDCVAGPDVAEVACADGVISPGLINPHDHITFAKNKPIGAGVDRYEHRHDWRIGKNGHQKLNVPGSATKPVVLAAELRFLMSGTTSAASAGGQAGLMRNIDTANLMEGLPIQPADSDTFPLGDSNGFQLASGCNYPNPVTTGEVDDVDAYLPHISEGINDFARNEFVCLSQGANDVVEPNAGIIHAIALHAGDGALIHPEKARVIWSPRSNIVLYGNTAQVTALDALGVPIALGTDWVASGSMNMQRELRCALELNETYYDGHFTDADLWKMVTTHAALATGSEKAIGRLKVGLVADIAVFNGATDKHHSAVVRADLEDTVLVLRGGEVLYGDSALVADPSVGGAACEAFDVCGVAKRACVAQDLGDGTTLQTLRTAIDPTYPLFFCGVPDLEPTCVPSRPGAYSGEITDADPDGDGLTADADNCPTVFNPPLMLAANASLDYDMDGIGDACDACPLEAGDACTKLDADDMDDDGVPNGSDNCPRDANGDQADADDDGHGDVCDACAEANPGPQVCPTTIPAIRNPMDPNHPNVNDAVSVPPAWVTAVRPNTGNSRGFYIQNDTTEPWNGIFVFTGGNAPGVQVGNRVSVSGVYLEFNGLAEIGSPKVTILDPGTDLPFEPILLDPATLATGKPNAEPYESMLVRVGPVEIVTQNPDAPMDYDEFAITGNLRVDDQVSDSVQNMGLNNACAVGSKFDDIVGILGFSFANSKLQPRNKTDVDLAAANMCDPFVP